VWCCPGGTTPRESCAHGEPVAGRLSPVLQRGCPGLQAGEKTRTARLRCFFGYDSHPVSMRMAYRCRAYPDQALQQLLPLRHQHQAFTAFFAGRARHPRFKSRRGRQTAHYTRSAFRISDCGWSEFRRQLAYKCARHGRDLIMADRWYPSSKTCSACGHLLAGLSLGIRCWTCPSCRARRDRDTNAAKNILAAGLAVSACGAGVRHTGSSRMQPAVKQEPQPARTGIPSFRAGNSQSVLLPR
jgi:Putative transposase DNA-binding domain